MYFHPQSRLAQIDPRIPDAEPVLRSARENPRLQRPQVQRQRKPGDDADF